MKLSAIIFLFVLSHGAIAQGTSGDAGKGEQLYYDYACYSCHGYNATMRVPLIGDKSGIMADEQLFLTFLRLRADQNPVNPKNTMPNYDVKVLSDEQALDIFAYIKSLKDDSPELDDIPVFVEILEAAKRGTNEE
jgi:mono/diheme cytochrome c family protein